MRLQLLVKTFGIGFLAILLLIPVFMIRELIHERRAYRDQVVSEIAQGWGARQTMSGPFVVVPYRKLWTEITLERVDGKMRESTSERSESGVIRLPVDTIDADIKLETTEKSRGIHSARLYAAKGEMTGRLTVPAQWGIDDPDTRKEKGAARYEFGAAALVLGIDDPRGLRTMGPLAFADRELPFKPGGAQSGIDRAVHANLGALDVKTAKTYDLRFAFELAGAEAFAIAPLAKDTRIALQANWPHPSFYGAFLPASHEIGVSGFKASWRISEFAAQSATRLANCTEANRCMLAGEVLGIGLIEPVGLYQQLDRASKYGFLFIGLTFAAFFLFELLRRLAIHPIQYGLVGLALAMFFLLLTALSEHLGFAEAYLAASVACVGLIAFYLTRVLQHVALGLGFAGALAALFGALYMLLKAEDYALVAGAGLLFVLLAATMIATRRVDWYALARRESSAA